MTLLCRALGILVSLVIVAVVYRISGLWRALRRSLFYVLRACEPYAKFWPGAVWVFDGDGVWNGSAPSSGGLAGQTSCDLLPMKLDLGASYRALWSVLRWRMRWRRVAIFGQTIRAMSLRRSYLGAYRKVSIRCPKRILSTESILFRRLLSHWKRY